ncbi:MAG: hypothetical protein QOK38_3625 [Acidobacteriaceae bacterium]|jgi:hypothetical protein|nr:hypothetical protein [Acidobacteriaceae bacterium]
MPMLAWGDFLNRNPAAHLVIGDVVAEGGAVTPQELDCLNRLLVQMIGRLSPTGAFAVVPKDGRPEIHCAFEEETDADRLAQAVNATAISGHGGWPTQRFFLLDGPTRRAIQAALHG